MAPRVTGESSDFHIEPEKGSIPNLPYTHIVLGERIQTQRENHFSSVSLGKTGARIRVFPESYCRVSAARQGERPWLSPSCWWCNSVSLSGLLYQVGGGELDQDNPIPSSKLCLGFSSEKCYYPKPYHHMSFSRAQILCHDFGLQRSYLRFSKTSGTSNSIALMYMNQS